MNKELGTAFAALAAFKADEWADWILRFVNDAAEKPFVSRGLEPPHLALNAIFDQLPETARPDFSTGLSRLVPQVRPEANVRQSFSLLKVLDHVSPWRAQPAMFSRLTSGCMRDIKYGGWDLHALLLVACCHFEIDQRLEDYIFRSVVSFNDFDYCIVAFRMLLRLGGARPFLLVEYLLPELHLPDRAERLMEVLLEALDERAGSWPLIHWFQEIAPRLKARGVNGVDLFEEVVRQVVPWNPESARSDAGLLLLTGWVHAPARYFRASDLVELSYTLHRLEQENRQQILKRVLQRILHYGESWDCIDGLDTNDPWNRIGIGDVLRIVTYAWEGDQTDEADVPRSGFLREFNLLREITLQRDEFSPDEERTQKRPRREAAKALAARSI